MLTLLRPLEVLAPLVPLDRLPLLALMEGLLLRDQLKGLSQLAPLVALNSLALTVPTHHCFDCPCLSLAHSFAPPGLWPCPSRWRRARHQCPSPGRRGGSGLGSTSRNGATHATACPSPGEGNSGGGLEKSPCGGVVHKTAVTLWYRGAEVRPSASWTEQQRPWLSPLRRKATQSRRPPPGRGGRGNGRDKLSFTSQTGQWRERSQGGAPPSTSLWGRLR